MTDNQPNGTELSYEAARDELIAVVKKLETGGTPLAESMQLWERGEKLADICEHWLDGAQARVEQTRTQQSRGEIAAEPPNAGE